MNVAFLIYRRPELTARVFAEIRKARPERLLIVADGPKDDGERPKCAAARAVVENVDWPCEVSRNYADVNLGCRKCVSSGLDWVFSHVEEAIILEDDCLPHPSFFRYCAGLLERYRNDERVMHISGDNFMKGSGPTAYSYYFSRCPYIWGWATWRRAWRHYDVEMKLWPQFRDSGLMANLWQSEEQRRHWTAACESAHNGEVNTWDYAWMFTCWSQSGLAIRPNINLVTNIGFGAEAVHTRNPMHPMSNLPSDDIGDIIHQPFVVQDVDADLLEFRQVISRRPTRVEQLQRTLLNRHWYGSLARKLPIVGSLIGRIKSTNRAVPRH